MESVTSFTVTGPPASTRCAKRDATRLAGASRVPQVARAGQAAITPVVCLARSTATVTVNVGAFAYLAMSRLNLRVPVILFIAHLFWPLGLVFPKEGLAGNAAGSIFAHLFAVWIDALARWVGLA